VSATATSTLRAIEPERWDRLVAGSAQGSVFLDTRFLAALDRRWELLGLGESGDPAALAMVAREADGRVARAPLPFTLYQGVVLPAEVEQMPVHRRVRETLERTTALLEALASQGVMSFCLHPRFPDLRAFSWFNYHRPEAGQFRLDLRYTGEIALDPGAGLDGFLAGCRSVRRQEYRKAAARFTVESSTDVTLLDELHERTFRRQGLERSARERDLMGTIARAAVGQGLGELLVARDGDGQPASAALFLFDAQTAYYLVAANDPDFRSAGTSTLLFVEGVRRALARGAGTVDVVGMNSPSRGDFKASFGAVPVPYFVAHWEGR
jgi:Acetyltransferase (GNAT) domain